uniref:Uncharacterized protein n=1 Tax=Arundo donax TaxID=35708 RepID=A0A0A9H2A4_ARUDO
MGRRTLKSNPPFAKSVNPKANQINPIQSSNRSLDTTE